MTTGAIKTKKVAFVIIMTGTYEVEYEDGVETPTAAFRHFPEAMGMGLALQQIYRFSEDVEVKWDTDDTRNYPDELGGFLMPEQPSPVVCEDCGRTVIAPDGVCPYCGIPVSQR